MNEFKDIHEHVLLTRLKYTIKPIFGLKFDIKPKYVLKFSINVVNEGRPTSWSGVTRRLGLNASITLDWPSSTTK